MTIIEIKNQLISHFYDHESFSMDDDGPKIRLSEDLEKVREAVIETVLYDLAASNLVRKVHSAEKSVWLLTQSFDSFSQTVHLSAPAAEMIADIINDFRDINDIPGDMCDKTKIIEADLVNLVNIIHVLLENEEIIEEDEEE